MGNNQTTRNNLIKWQHEIKRWAQYVSLAIYGHRKLRTSSYSEQNHWSLVARVPDNRTWTIDQFIVEAIKRTGHAMVERQSTDSSGTRVLGVPLKQFS